MLQQSHKCKHSDHPDIYPNPSNAMDNTELRLEIEKIKAKLDNQGKNMELVFRYMDELIEKKSEPKPRKRIGFKSDDI
jgi:hypothetical protein